MSELANGFDASIVDEKANKVGPAGIEIAYQRLGNPDAPLVLLIMGIAAQSIAWPDAFCHVLVDRGLQVIRFDNRDVGLWSPSCKPGTSRWSPLFVPKTEKPSSSPTPACTPSWSTGPSATTTLTPRPKFVPCYIACACTTPASRLPHSGTRGNQHHPAGCHATLRRIHLDTGRHRQLHRGARYGRHESLPRAYSRPHGVGPLQVRRGVGIFLAHARAQRRHSVCEISPGAELATIPDHRLPRRACSLSRASKSALKLPLPKLRLPLR